VDQVWQIVKGGAFLSLHSFFLTLFRKMNLVCIESYISLDVYRATSSSIRRSGGNARNEQSCLC